MRPLARRLRSICLAAACLVLAACGTTPPPPAQPASQPAAATGSPAAPTPPSKPLQPVSLALPWLMTGEDAGFVMARDLGYYRDAGLDMTIQPGTNSLLAAELVSEGRNTFAFTDGGAVAAVVSKGGAIKMLAALDQESPAGLAHNPDVPLSSPQDLKGKTIIANSTGGPVVQMLFAVLDRAGIPRSDVHLQLITPSAVAAEFKTHPQDLLSTFENGSFPQVLKLDPQAVFVPYAKFGVNTLSLGIVARTADIQQHAQLVRGFVAASLKGWDYAAAHPKETIDAMVKDYPKGNAFIWGKSLEFSLQLEHTPATAGKPLGWMAASDWQSTLKLLHDYSGLKTVGSPDNYYTNTLLPQS